MKKVITVIAVALTFAACTNTNEITIKLTGDNEGRSYYSVYMPNGTVHEYMYAEEIARGLSEDNWSADEDLILSYANQE
jgi:hypothetical protein